MRYRMAGGRYSSANDAARSPTMTPRGLIAAGPRPRPPPSQTIRHRRTAPCPGPPNVGRRVGARATYFVVRRRGRRLVWVLCRLCASRELHPQSAWTEAATDRRPSERCSRLSAGRQSQAAKPGSGPTVVSSLF